jgi:hypothetical protein
VSLKKPIRGFRSLLVLVFGFAYPLSTPLFAAADHRPTWLWVQDDNTHIGIADASVDIWPEGDRNAVAHYKTGRAGRVLIDGVPARFECRVSLNQLDLPVESTSQELSGSFPPAQAAVLRRVLSEKVRQTIIYVKKEKTEGSYEDWNSITPTIFRAYVQDQNARELLSGVEVKAIRSGITTHTDPDGLVTVEIPASFRTGKTPSIATETLGFSKRGYKNFEYRQLVLHPGLNSLDILLTKGTGSVVRKNMTLTNAENLFKDEFVEFRGALRAIPNGYAGEIISLEIVPSVYEGGWIMYGRDANAVVHARNMKDIVISWTPTGTGVTTPVTEGKMKKVKSSSDGDVWELELSDQIMSTSFEADGTDTKNRSVRSIDLGNVGVDDRY